VEFKKVVGDRRSIRYYLPYRPVEREKIQTMLEAARLSSRAVNADWGKAVVVYRDELSPEDREKLKTPTSTAQLDLAPVYIFWYADPKAGYASGTDALKRLVDYGVLNPSHGWSHAYVDNVVWPQVLAPVFSTPEAIVVISCVEAGLAICQAMLAAVDEGLGTLLTAFNREYAGQVLGVPEHWIPLWVQLVGYSAESPQAGGQRPRAEAWNDIYFEGRYGQPFERREEVVEALTAQGMIQEPAPIEWRKAEVRALSNMFGLPE
jgi:nitroreductase